MEKREGRKIRCFVIADDYRWHILTDSFEEFQKATEAYLELMSSSGKENNYYFKNLFLEEQEYLQILRNLSPRKFQQRSRFTRKNHLRLVE